MSLPKTSAEEAIKARDEERNASGDDSAAEAFETFGKYYTVKAPDRNIWRRYGSLVTDTTPPETSEAGLAREDAYEGLALACAIYPPREGLIALFDRFPLLPKFMAGSITSLAIGNAEGEAKKL